LALKACREYIDLEVISLCHCHWLPLVRCSFYN